MNVTDNFWEGKTVLLTGHTGFKGSWLSLMLLKLGAEIIGFSLEPQDKNNLYEKLLKSNPEFYKANFKSYFENILDLRKLKETVRLHKPDIVFHLAAQPLVIESYKDPLNTWSTNVIGSLNLLESLKSLDHRCSVVVITTDKVYKNMEWEFGYRESDMLGGHDPYSSSKAAAEIAISSWRDSFVDSIQSNHQNLLISTARSGNVIGGGDWSKDRIIPDAIKYLLNNETIKVRNPKAKRPWQHVLEPLEGYLELAKNNYLSENPRCEAFNFGPRIENNRSVEELIKNVCILWPGEWMTIDNPNKLHEAELLNLQIDKAYQTLNWEPIWGFSETVERTINWYKSFIHKKDVFECCIEDINSYKERKISRNNLKI